MSSFLEDVFAAQAEHHEPRRRRRRRKPAEGLSGSGRRYALLLTLMVSLTAVPTWIMLRAGVSGLEQATATPVQPLLLPQGTPPSTTRALPEPQLTLPWPQLVRPVPPAPAGDERAGQPVLERRSVVDTSSRPTQKKKKTPEKPAKVTPKPSDPAPTPTAPNDRDNCLAIAASDPAASVNCLANAASSAAADAASAAADAAVKAKRARLAERPDVEKPEPPNVERPRQSEARID